MEQFVSCKYETTAHTDAIDNPCIVTSGVTDLLFTMLL